MQSFLLIAPNSQPPDLGLLHSMALGFVTPEEDLWFLSP